MQWKFEGDLMNGGFPYHSGVRKDRRTKIIPKWRKPPSPLALDLIQRYACEHAEKCATPYMVGVWLIENNLPKLSSYLILQSFEQLRFKQIVNTSEVGPPRYFVMPMPS